MYTYNDTCYINDWNIDYRLHLCYVHLCYAFIYNMGCNNIFVQLYFRGHSHVIICCIDKHQKLIVKKHKFHSNARLFLDVAHT